MNLRTNVLFSCADSMTTGASFLGGTEAIHVSTVLEDCVDQLAVLGRIMPGTYVGASQSKKMVDDEISRLVFGQKQLEDQFQTVADQKGEEAAVKKQEAAGQLRNSTHVFARSMKQSPLTPDNLEKVQSDRGFLEKVLWETLVELSNSGGFTSLCAAVHLEKEKKAGLQATILREEDGRKRMKQLQKKVADVKEEKIVEMEQRNEMIAHLKDQLQEMKAKTNMEGKYIKKCAEVSVSQTQKRCGLTEKEMKEEIEKLKQKIDEENRCNAEIESFLRTHTESLQKKVEEWMEKYDKDVEAKQKQLDVLKASKAKDLERLKELTKLYSEYEQVVVEDRIEKEKARRKAELEAEELKAAVRVQSWWRGVMVRKQLGPYNKKKKKKGKKGKKSGKKKK